MCSWTFCYGEWAAFITFCDTMPLMIQYFSPPAKVEVIIMRGKRRAMTSLDIQDILFIQHPLNCLENWSTFQSNILKRYSFDVPVKKPAFSVGTWRGGGIKALKNSCFLSPSCPCPPPSKGRAFWLLTRASTFFSCVQIRLAVWE